MICKEESALVRQAVLKTVGPERVRGVQIPLLPFRYSARNNPTKKSHHHGPVKGPFSLEEVLMAPVANPEPQLSPAVAFEQLLSQAWRIREETKRKRDETQAELGFFILEEIESAGDTC